MRWGGSKGEAMKAGDRVYRVVWKDGQPCVEGGRLVQTGAKCNRLRAFFPRDFKGVMPDDAATSLKQAVANEIIRCAKEFAPDGVFDKRQARPWSLVVAVTKLWRLYRKLKRHHLV